MSQGLEQTNPLAKVKFVDFVPPVVEKRERNDKFWKDVANLLKFQPGVWAQVKTYDNPKGAASKASVINTGKAAIFPKDQFEARHKVVGEGERQQSILYIMYKTPTETF